MAYRQSIKSISVTGIVFVVLGLGMVLYEFQSEFMLQRLGLLGRGIMLVCGTALSVWGLKEVIAGYWPRLAGKGYHFNIPLEGAVYLLIMIALFVGSLIGRNNPLMMVFAVMAGPFIMNGWFTFTMLKGLKVSRELPERIMAGEPFTVSLTLGNPKSWMSVWLMLLRDAATHPAGAVLPEVLFVRVSPASQRRGHYQLQLNERGVYRFGPVNISTRFPLGLVQRGLTLETPGQLLVYPRLGRLHPEWRRQAQHAVELISHVRPQVGTYHDELHRLREYRAGDDPRRIHWPTTARMNELMVCDYQESRDRDLVVIVDAWVPERPERQDHDRVELALRFAATIVMDQLHSYRGSSLRARIVGKQIFEWSGGGGEHHTDELLDGFALAESSSRSMPGDLIAGLELEDLGQRRTIIITPRPQTWHDDPTIAAEMRGRDAQIFGAIPDELSSIFEDHPCR